MDALCARGSADALGAEVVAWMAERGFVPATRGVERLDASLELAEDPRSSDWVALRAPEDPFLFRDAGDAVGRHVSEQRAAVLLRRSLEVGEVRLYLRGERALCTRCEDGRSLEGDPPEAWSARLGDPSLTAPLEAAVTAWEDDLDPRPGGRWLDVEAWARALGIGPALYVAFPEDDAPATARGMVGQLLHAVERRLDFADPAEAAGPRRRVGVARAALGHAAPAAPAGVRRLGFRRSDD